MKVFRLVGIKMILVVGLCVVSQAADEPNFRAMGVPAEISIFESADLLSRLQLTGEQQKLLQVVLDDGKARFLTAKSEYEARPAAHQRGPYRQRRDDLLKNAISDLLDDRQHQLFHQMLALNFQSPVQASGAFRFDLKLTEKQHEQLHELETQWIQYALEQVPCSYRYPRHTEERDISKYGPLLKYGANVARVAWDFVPRRDERWNRILTPEQAKRTSLMTNRTPLKKLTQHGQLVGSSGRQIEACPIILPDGTLAMLVACWKNQGTCRSPVHGSTAKIPVRLEAPTALIP